MSLVRVQLGRARIVGEVRHADARGAASAREGTLVFARADGRTGLGEASPLPGVSPDSLEACLGGLDALGPSLDVALAPDALAADPRLAALPPAARMGLETALLDLAAQRAGVPLAMLLAEHAPPAERLDTQVLVPADADAAALGRALGAGARALKLKIGAPGALARDRRLLSEARALAPEAVLRADANEAGLAPALVEALAAARVELCEDPLPLDVLAAPGRVPLPFPVALDAAVVRDPGAALSAVRSGLAAALVLKPTALGGLLRARALAREVRALGARAIVSHALESPVGLAASAHLALALGPGEVHGLARYDGLERFVPAGRSTPLPVPEWLGACALSAPGGSGLGVGW